VACALQTVTLFASTIAEATMKLSARNQINGTVTAVTIGAVNATVKVDIGGGNIVTSSITNEAIEDLGLAVGEQVTVFIKSSDVLIGK
jgi:molybdopterin-binding protein